MSERITKDKEFDGYERNLHEYRYKVAGKYTTDEDTVLDAACGIGYGKEFLKGKYIGVDIVDLGADIIADLTTWQPNFEFDVAVCFETIEHLKDHTNLLNILKKAKKYICLSAPIIPTVGINEFHLQDFTYEELKNILNDWGTVIHEEKQDNVYGIFIIKKNEV